MNKEIKLLPCPFCGSTSISYEYNGQGCKWGACMCNDCGSFGPEVRTQYTEVDWYPDATKAWNRRVKDE